MLLEKKLYYFDEDDILYFRAQGSKDRSGFYKEWYDGVLIAEKIMEIALIHMRPLE